MAGNTQAFRVIVEEHQAFAYSVAYRFVGNEHEAEDITQEAFLRLWKNLKSYRTDIKLSTWLYRIVANLCLDYLKSAHNRQQKNRLDMRDVRSVSDSRTADKEVQEHELIEVIMRASEELTPKQKAVFIMRDLEELSVEEVSQALNMSPGNVKSNLYYARQKVSETLKSWYQTTDKIQQP